MTSGRVIATRKPLVPITVLDNLRNPHTIQFVLDTGFTGQLLLPNRFANRLGSCQSPTGSMHGRQPGIS